MKGSTILSESILTGLSIVISFILIVLVVRVVISQQTDRTYKNLFESIARDIVVIIDKLSSTTGSGLIEYEIPKGLHINIKIDYKSVFIYDESNNIKKSFSGNLNSGPYIFNEPTILCFAKSKYDNEIVIVDKKCSCDIKPGVCDIISVTTTTTIPRPRPGCRVYFSGVLISGKVLYLLGNSFPDSSQAFTVDDFSELVAEGEYPSNEDAFPKAIGRTFDGIAIDDGTRLIIYSDKNFQGDVLLDVTGPVAISNGIYRHWTNNCCNAIYDNINWPSDLATIFPPETRKWSDNDMHNWSYGSCKIICEGTT